MHYGEKHKKKKAKKSTKSYGGSKRSTMRKGRKK
tara:strand:- start:117 stop:218 length:102 start_codon:yes stop_codon:yes gene_type:complete